MIRRFRQHYQTQYRLSLLAGFGPRKAQRRAVRTFFFGF